MQRAERPSVAPLRPKHVRRAFASTVVLCVLLGFGVGLWVGQWRCTAAGGVGSKGWVNAIGSLAYATKNGGQVGPRVGGRADANLAPHLQKPMGDAAASGRDHVPPLPTSAVPRRDHGDDATTGVTDSYEAFLHRIRFPDDALLPFGNHSSSDINVFLHQRASSLPSAQGGGADATLFLIPVNEGYLDFGLNLMCSLLNVSGHDGGAGAAIAPSSPHRGFVFVAMDEPAHMQLAAMGLPVVRDPDVPFVSSKSAAWADPKFHSLVCTKLIPVLRALRQGLRVVLSDADVVFLRNPLPFFRSDASLTFSIGSCHKDIRDNFRFTSDGIEKLNTGFYVAHPTAAVERLFSRALETCRGSSLTGDQPAINAAIQADWASGVLPPSPDADHSPNHSSTYSYAFFDGCMFANGCVYFKHLCENTTKYPPHMQRAYQAAGAASLLSLPRNGKPVMVHANFLVGKKNKIRHLTKYGLWDPVCINHWRGRVARGAVGGE